MTNKKIPVSREWLLGLIEKADHVGEANESNNKHLVNVEINMLIAYIYSAKNLLLTNQSKLKGGTKK